MMRINNLKSLKNGSLPIKAAFWFTFASMLQKAMAFITVPIFTRVMETEQYGVYSAYLSWCSILTVFLTLNLEAGAYSNVLGKCRSDKEKADMTISYSSLCFCITLIAALCCCFFKDAVTTFMEIPFELIVLMLLNICTKPVINYWMFQQRFQYEYKLLVIVVLIKSLASVCLGLFIVCNVQENWQAMGRIFSVVVVEGILSVPIYFHYVRTTKKFFLIKKWKTTLKYQLPLIPHFLAMNLLLSSDRIMIQKMVGAAEAAIYSVAYSAGQIMTILKSCIVDALRPWIYEKLNNKDYKSISSVTTVLTLVVTVISVLFAVVAPEIIYVLAAKQYYEAIYVIPPVALSSLFTFVYQLFVVIENYFGKTTNIMLASTGAAFINLVLNFICIPRFGYVAAGYTTLISYIFLSVLHYRTIKMIQKDELNDISLFNVHLLAIVSAVGIVMCIGVSVLYKNALVRYCVIGMLAIICMFYGKRIMRVCEKLKKK